MQRGVSTNRATWAGVIGFGTPTGIGLSGSGMRGGSIFLYWPQKEAISTTRSLRTGMLRIGSTTSRPCFAISSPIGVWQARRLFELITIAHEPQIALRQGERGGQ